MSNDENNDFIPRVPKTEKTDWKNDIRHALVQPIYAVNDYHFMDLVEDAKNIVANTYPGWDAYSDVTEKVKEIRDKWIGYWTDWKDKNIPCKRYTRMRAKHFCNVQMNQEIWTFLKNYCAIRGIMVEGPRDSQSVSYDEDEDT
jgi:hypothetical protein